MALINFFFIVNSKIIFNKPFFNNGKKLDFKLKTDKFNLI